MRSVKYGLDILLLLHKPGEVADVSAEHDAIYASGPPLDEVPDDVVKRLEELGWSWYDDVGRWVKFV